MVEAVTRALREAGALRDARRAQGVRRHRRARRCRPRRARRRGVRAGRAERRRQEHADVGSRRRDRSRRRHDDAERRAVRAARSARSAQCRRGDDLSGAVARAALERDGQHRAWRRAARGRACSARSASFIATRCADGARGARAARPSGHPGRAPVGELSPAAQQLVEIARALACGCRVLVLDEPTSSLAHGDVRKLFELIGRLKQQGLAIVYISHFIEEVTQVSDRFVVLRDGRNAGEGRDIRRPAAIDIVSLMVGRTLDDLYPRGPRAIGEAAARSWRSSRQDAGSGLVHAAPRRDFRHRRSARRRTDPAAPRVVRPGCGAKRIGEAGRAYRPDRSCGLVAPRHGHAQRRPHRRRAGDEPERRRQPDADAPRRTGARVLCLAGPAAQQREAWIDRLEIRATGPAQEVSRLSGGNQQKIALARLLHHDVDVLVLDEPTRGIDVASKAQIYRLIDELGAATPRCWQARQGRPHRQLATFPSSWRCAIASP